MGTELTTLTFADLGPGIFACGRCIGPNPDQRKDGANASVLSVLIFKKTICAASVRLGSARVQEALHSAGSLAPEVFVVPCGRT